jgi:hypothetical protein
MPEDAKTAEGNGGLSGAGILNTATQDSSTSCRGRGLASKTIELRNTAREILEEIKPASVRAVCYQLFNRKLIPDMSKKSTDKVSRVLRVAREDGLIPWSWIVDEAREVERIPQWRDASAFIDIVSTSYRRDYWQQQPVRVEVWSEKGTIRGPLKPVLDEWGVTFRAMHGFTSATVVHEVATSTRKTKKPLIVFYVGDYDPSGMHMSEVDLPGRVQRYGGSFTIKRIALTGDDVHAGELPYAFSATTKTKDPRHKWFVEIFGATCWELDAMNPNTLRERVDNAIENVLDVDAWNRCKNVERAEVVSLKDVLSQWPGSRP